MYARICFLAFTFATLAGCNHSQTRGAAPEEVDHEDAALKPVQRIADVAHYANPAPIQLSGVGLVVGLDGTGGPAPNTEFKRMLKNNLEKDRVPNAAALLSDPNCTMVFVSTRIPADVRKGDRVEVEITLPEGSACKSLRGGYLMECSLKNFDSRQHLNPTAGADQLLLGHTLAVAKGQLMVNLSPNEAEEESLRRAVIWNGAVCLCDQQLYLYLNKDQCFASVANAVANRINSAFPEETQRKYQTEQTKRLQLLEEVTSQINDKMQGARANGHGDSAVAVQKDIVNVRVPFQYRLNVARYMTVVENIPLRETPEIAAKYRQRLKEMLLEPRETIRAAVRLEALGKESIPALKAGLTSPSTLVRFAAAESLSYLGSTVGVDELIRLSQDHETLRGPCVAALASLDESVTQARLGELLNSPTPPVRYGAFRALLTANEANREVRGNLVGRSIWVHHVAALSMEPMIHFCTSRRAEIVFFGAPPALTPPFTVTAAKEYVISAAPGDDHCIVSRFATNRAPERKQCSLQIEDVMLKIIQLGGQYPELVEFLRQADNAKCMACPILTDQLPEMVDIKFLAACGRDANEFKDKPEFYRAVLAAQHDLGIMPADAAAAGQRQQTTQHTGTHN
jgi:flagellar basal body P-ring protein FlgI